MNRNPLLIIDNVMTTAISSSDEPSCGILVRTYHESQDRPTYVMKILEPSAAALPPEAD